MSNLPLNPCKNFPGSSQMNTNAGASFGHVPTSQLPPGYGSKQDPNSNSPQHVPLTRNNIQNVNNFNQSASNSPAFNQPGMMSPVPGLLASPMRPTPSQNSNPNCPPPPLSSVSPRTVPVNPSPAMYASSYQQKQINDNTPPLIPSSQFNQPLVNGPHLSQPGLAPGQYSVSSTYNTQIEARPPVSIGHQGAIIPAVSQSASGLKPGPTTFMISQSSVPFSNAPLGPPRNSPLISGPVIRPPTEPPSHSGSSTGSHLQSQWTGVNGPNVTGPSTVQTSLATMGQTSTFTGPQHGPQTSRPSTSSHQQQFKNGSSGQLIPPGPPAGHATAPSHYPQNPQVPGPHSIPPMGPSSLPSMRPPLGPVHQGPLKSNMQNRYPQMASSNYVNNQGPQIGQQMGQQLTMKQQYPQQYSAQSVTQQMGQLSVTKQGFDQLWGHHMVDLLQCRHILPEYPEDPPEIKLGHQFAETSNCSPEIFRCTINRIPETNSLLQKSRLPLGILIHPFKDLNHLPVIQCSTIVRCRSCRTYINPFVYFVDAKRWKCNLCFRVNDLPEEFQYDPVSKSYGDPARRPEIRSATIEFIAPGEYMLRPPQPAVYLFLFDVSQLARESGYLQVVCETLKSSLDQLPGDARTQIGFICYDAHVHYYLMSEGLTRPKEMTVLDIEDVFLPSPESLLVNLGERRELVKELLGVLPQRYSAPGAPASALGAALQAGYKLMAPTGGRITVFQTCLPNLGPGALQSREDPNARSSKDVAHLNPATDFYKRLALDCSGAQVAVDLFLLNSQYCDLATLSGMSKFSAGSVYHAPLFRATKSHHAEQLARALTRYLTRKIGFEAVMRVRCTRGISIHTFHGNFFVRSTDLLSLPNVSPDAGFGMQLTIEESLSDLQQVCFQAALLYTSSKGERRIRVHTLALPTASNLTDVLHSADQHCIIGLLCKMAVDRCVSASLVEAREALMNVAVDAMSAFRLSQNLPAGTLSAALHAPASLRLLPLYLLATLKRKAFRTGTSTRLDDRVADMCALKSWPLGQLLRAVYPDLYALHTLRDHTLPPDDDEEPTPDPPRMHLTAERINSNGAYLLDDGDTMLVYVCSGVSPAFLSDTFGVTAFSQLSDEAHCLPRLDTEGSALLHAFIDKLNDERPYASDILVLRDNSPSRTQFTERLVDDRVESAFSYYEFLQHVKNQVK